MYTEPLKHQTMELAKLIITVIQEAEVWDDFEISAGYTYDRKSVTTSDSMDSPRNTIYGCFLLGDSEWTVFKTLAVGYCCDSLSLSLSLELFLENKHTHTNIQTNKHVITRTGLTLRP